MSGPRAAGAFALALGAFACAADPPAESAERPRNVARPFEPAFRNEIRVESGIRTRGRTVIRTAAAWDSLWRANVPGPLGPLPHPAVDFARDMVVAVTLGRVPSGGYVVTIDSVVVAPSGAMTAYVREEVPGRCGVSGAVTTPADMVLVPRSEAPVHFAERPVATRC